MPANTPLTEALSRILTTRLPGFQGIEACEQLTAGASQQTFRILAATREGAKKLALRRGQPGVQGESVSGQVGLETEALLLQLAGQAGIPVPEVIYVLQESDELGDGFLMEWLEGETLGKRIVRSESLAEVRPQLARQCGEVLARLHAIELDDRLLDVLPTITPAELVQETWQVYQALDVPVPMIDFSARWLLENLPPASRQTLVHGDFRNGNLMVDERGIRAVLDWELAQIGDPVRDLGWLCVNSWRFGRADLPVGGFGLIEDLLEGYRSVSGIAVSRQALQFWQVFGSFWWSVTTLTMAATWRSGETPSLERPVIGRRSSEAQMDCVNLLIPGPFQLPDEVDLAAGTQMPMPAELLEGVRAFLQEEVTPQESGQFAFLARVAANSLGIAQREFLYGPGLGDAEQQRLRALFGDGSLDALRWRLVNELRGSLPLATSQLAEHLRQSVATQLWVDQPGYSGLGSPQA